jgi:hypothetical protein
LKEKIKQSTSGLKPKDSSTLFLNISIIILSILILFLSYSFLDKINVFNTHTVVNEPVQYNKLVQMEILNGCGVSGVADQFTDALRKKNFDIVHTGNYISFNIDESIIISRTVNNKSARDLAETLGIDETRVINQVNKNYFLDITLIIGKDYKQLFRK